MADKPRTHSRVLPLLKSMNVLVNCLPLKSGGAIAYLQSLAPLLNLRFKESSGEHRIKFLAYREQDQLLGTVEDAHVICIRRNRQALYHRMLWEYINLARLVDEEKVDVLFTPYQISPLIYGTMQVLMIRNMEPFLSGEYEYSLNSRLRNQTLRWMSFHALRRANRVVAVSRFTRNYLIKVMRISENRIKTIYHGRRPCSARNRNSTRDHDLLTHIGVEEKYIFTCGSLLPYRRYEDVITAFNRCVDHLPTGTRLVIAGSGTDRRYDKLIRKTIAASPYSHRILALGHVNNETMAALYRHSLVCIIATEIEACPNIAIEAMAAGCAIVSSDRPPLMEMFHGCSLEYRARDVSHLAQQMLLIVEDTNLRRGLKARAQKRAEIFSWEKCAKETYEALTEW